MSGKHETLANATSIMSVQFLLDYWSLTIQISDEAARRSALCRIFYLNNFFFQIIFVILLLFVVYKTVSYQHKRAADRFIPTLRSSEISRHVCMSDIIAPRVLEGSKVSVYRTLTRKSGARVGCTNTKASQRAESTFIRIVCVSCTEHLRLVLIALRFSAETVFFIFFLSSLLCPFLPSSQTIRKPHHDRRTSFTV